MEKKEKFRYYLAGSISLVTFIVYLTTLRNEFLRWDDDLYVINNPFIRSFNMTFVKRAFGGVYAYNWHPLTWLSHALDYAIWGLNPLGHHLTNVFLHTANTFMVVLIIIGLLQAAKEKTIRTTPLEFITDRTTLIAAGATGILFGLHPIHVESVAWIAERKDLLCGMFFLLGITFYIKYERSINSESIQGISSPFYVNRPYVFSLGFFILALLSKPMAVSFPVVLLILDWYPFERIRSLETFRTVLIEKLPFFALSLVSSILTVLAQKEGGALKSMVFSPLSTRVLVGAKSLIAYLWNMMVPINLVPYYAYPRNASFLSFEYLSVIILVIGITMTCVVMAGKQKLWLAAWGYYVVTLVPVLGIIQVGSQSMADRYTYLPSLGLFVVIGVVIAGVSRKADIFSKGRSVFTVAGRVMFISVTVVMIYLTVQQIGIWKDDVIFWSHAIQKSSQKMPIAYNNRGAAYEKMGQFDTAIADYDMAIASDPSFYLAFYNRAVAFEKTGQIDRAIADYDKTIGLNPSYYAAYYNRAVLFERTGQKDRAIADYDKITAQIDRAISGHDKEIAANPSFAKAYLMRGVLYCKAGSYEKALEYLNKYISINKSDTDGYGTRGIVFDVMGQYDRALEDYNKSLELDPNIAETYFNRGDLYQKKGSRDLAFADFQKACSLGDEEACKRLQRM